MDILSITGFALAGAMRLRGNEREAGREFANRLCGQGGQDANAVLVAANDQSDGATPDSLSFQRAGMLRNLVDSLAYSGFCTEEQRDGLAAFAERPLGEVSPMTRAYAHLTGIAPGGVAAELIQSTHDFIGWLQFNVAPPLDMARLMVSLEPYPADRRLERNDYDDGTRILAGMLPELTAAQPDGKPFTPAVVWRTIFQADPPADVNPGNLAAKVGSAWHSRMNETLDGLRDRAVGDSSWNSEVAVVNFDGSTRLRAYEEFAGAVLTLITMGISPLRTLALMNEKPEARSLALRDLSYPGAIIAGPRPPLDQAERKAVEQIAVDLHRMEQTGVNISLTIGDHPGINLNAESIADPEERRNYEDGKQENAIIRQVTAGVTELCGSGENAQAQRTSVFLLVSQSGQAPNRFAAPAIGLTLKDEHTPMNYRLDRLEGGRVRVALELPGEISGYSRIVYEVEPNGEYRMTDLLVSHSRPQAETAGG